MNHRLENTMERCNEPRVTVIEDLTHEQAEILRRIADARARVIVTGPEQLRLPLAV